MLVRIMPNQITKHWYTLIGPAIAMSLPPIVREEEEIMSNVLASLVADRMQCWKAETLDEDGEPRIMGLLVTSTVEDNCAGARNLLIFALYGLRFMDEEFWNEGYRDLQEIAKARGCNKIVAYSSNKRVIEMTDRLGGDSSYRLITLPVMNGEKHG